MKEFFKCFVVIFNVFFKVTQTKYSKIIVRLNLKFIYKFPENTDIKFCERNLPTTNYPKICVTFVRQILNSNFVWCKYEFIFRFHVNFYDYASHIFISIIYAILSVIRLTFYIFNICCQSQIWENLHRLQTQMCHFLAQNFFKFLKYDICLTSKDVWDVERIETRFLAFFPHY
jgi:hypothetical protein